MPHTIIKKHTYLRVAHVEVGGPEPQEAVHRQRARRLAHGDGRAGGDGGRHQVHLPKQGLLLRRRGWGRGGMVLLLVVLLRRLLGVVDGEGLEVRDDAQGPFELRGGRRPLPLA